ncbi:hypothetical protein CIB95_08595 [Lottiidibacillus patelloidae]|uniref:Inner membrane protein YgaP-like transmembrane domain-containing protein n=1 Tax=Lottiidibacillus patelloidae TaxID=2670334 RepID=A0A263BTD0_9BACI|nr:DUF2892 domain-containing protein [Lottiidibacillus patelloidae]OZM56822.1 hypothetical protein CIB95_08595 [Lottiidibacillus patelloidae]
MRPNIGIINAMIRITCGLTMLSWSTAKLVKRPWCQSYLWVVLLGAMKVAQGITRFCPITELMKCMPKKGDCCDIEEEKEIINPS